MFKIRLIHPFLDVNVLREAFKIPPRFLLKEGYEKYILRRLLLELGAPPELAWRNKVGFCIPIARWYQNKLKDFISKLLDTLTLVKDGILDGTYVKELFLDFLRGKRRNIALVGAIINMELWYRYLRPLMSSA